MIGDRRVLGIIPARAGSQGLPGKNVRPLAGRPMIAWTLLAGQASATIDRLVVSTDDDAVVAAAGALGIEVVRRPPELASATASVIDAIDHVLQVVGGNWDYLVLLQPTSPLRRADDIDGAVRLCDATGAPSVIGVSPMPKPAGFYGRVAAGGVFVKAEQAAASTEPDAMEQDEAVVINGAVYVGRPECLARDRSFQSVGTQGWLMPPARGWDVDTLMDFVVCEALWPFRDQADAVLDGVRR